MAITLESIVAVLPLIGYNYAANKWERMRSVIKTAFIYSVVVALVGAVLLFACAVLVVKGFIDDAETVAYPIPAIA